MSNADYLWDEPWHSDYGDDNGSGYALARRRSYEPPVPVVARNRSTFVPPAPAEVVRHVESYRTPANWPMTPDAAPPPMMVEARVTGNYQDRARGFSHVITVHL